MDNHVIDRATLESLAEAVFSKVPYMELLAWLTDYQSKIKPEDITAKYKTELVSPADIESQTRLVEYFKNSPLFSYCNIRGEEMSENLPSFDPKKEYQIIIDPIDGSPEYAKGGECWGIMIGVCDKAGRNVYSWFVTSTGELLTSRNVSLVAHNSFSECASTKGKILIDVYGYGDEVLTARAKSEIQSRLGGLGDFAQFTSLPAALWAARDVVTGKSSGLLWLPSTMGKGGYPDYDLVFLDAVQRAGLKVMMARTDETPEGSEGKVQMFAIASTDDDLAILWKSGVSALGDAYNPAWKIDTKDLIIT